MDGFFVISDDMETDDADKETTKSEEKKETEKDKTSSSGKNGKDIELAPQPIKEEIKTEAEIKTEEEEESKSGDSAVVNGNQDENTNDEDIEDVSLYIYKTKSFNESIDLRSFNFVLSIDIFIWHVYIVVFFVKVVFL
jgi:beta-glucosidase-like glycosyl hydrolase